MPPAASWIASKCVVRLTLVKTFPGQSVGHIDIQLLWLPCSYVSSCLDCNDSFELLRSQPVINNA
jgi:hypothetical protein